MKRLLPLGNKFKISVLICTRNRTDALLACVRSLLLQTRIPDELVIVDSSDSAGLEDILSPFIGFKIPLVYFRSEPGLTKQRNIGISLAHFPVVVFLDDDTVLDRGYISAIFAIYAGDVDGEIAGVQGSFIQREIMSRIGIYFRRLFLLPGNTGLGRMQASGFPSYIDTPNAVVGVDMVCGGNTSYRSEVLREVKWNEQFSGYSYMEDDDYSYRVSRDYRLVQTPAAFLVHNHSPEGRDNIEKQINMEVRNHMLFFRLNMPGKVWNIIAFVWSEIGCCLLTIRTHRWRGLKIRANAYVLLCENWNGPYG